MRSANIIYWTSSGLFTLFYGFSITLYALRDPDILASLERLGYPSYIITMLLTAKVIGLASLLQNQSVTLKEWAYAGFTINLVIAGWSHAAIQEPFLPQVLILSLLTASYLSWKQRLKLTRERVV